MLLGKSKLEVSKILNQLYIDSGKNLYSSSSSSSSINFIEKRKQLIQEIILRKEEFSNYELPGIALCFNFITMSMLINWNYRKLEPISSIYFDLSPWPEKASNELKQSEFNDVLRCLCIAWRILKPNKKLYQWINALDQRAAYLCTSSFSINDNDLDESYDILDIDSKKERIPVNEFILDTSTILFEMFSSFHIYDHLRNRFKKRIYLTSSSFHFNDDEIIRTHDYLFKCYDEIIGDSKEEIDEKIAKYSLRPGELHQYARHSYGIKPDDSRVILVHCRPLLSDYRKRPISRMKSYVIFDHICRRKGFDWFNNAFLSEENYFNVIERNIRCCDILIKNKNPTIIRVMGNDYVYFNSKLYYCSRGTEEAIYLWIYLIPKEI